MLSFLIPQKRHEDFSLFPSFHGPMVCLVCLGHKTQHMVKRGSCTGCSRFPRSLEDKAQWMSPESARESCPRDQVKITFPLIIHTVLCETFWQGCALICLEKFCKLIVCIHSAGCFFGGGGGSLAEDPDKQRETKKCVNEQPTHSSGSTSVCCIKLMDPEKVKPVFMQDILTSSVTSVVCR